MVTHVRFPALPVNHLAFHKIDTHQKAYLLGFLLADGCVIPARQGHYRARVNLKILAGDIYACSMIQEIAGGNLRLMEGGYRVIWEVNSDAMAADLNALGITPRKTFTAALQWDLIPAHLHGAVLAGLIDGDGNLRCSRAERRAQVSIATGSAALKEQLVARFTFFTAVEIPPKGKRLRTLYRIGVESNRERMRALIDVVYASLPFPVLERKQVLVDDLRADLSRQDAYDAAMEQVAPMKAAGFTIAEIASEVGTSVRPIQDRLRAQGIDSRRVIFTEDDRQEMGRLHAQGLSVLQVHRAIDKGTEQAIRFHLQSMGHIKKAMKKAARHQKADTIMALHRDGNTLSGISGKVGVGVVVVSRVLRQEGIILVKGSPMKLSVAGIEWAVAELAKGRTLKSVSDELGVSTTLVRTRLKERALPQPPADSK